LAEIEDVAVGPQAADDFGARRGVNGLAQGADRDHAVIADADAGLLAPDIGPPRTGWGGTQDGTVLSQGLGAGGLWSGTQFAMDFVLIGVEEELVEEAVGRLQIQEVISGQERGKAFLPVVVAAFDFAFGLGSGGVTQGDAIEMQGGSELGESVWGVGEEEGVEVHIQGQGEAVSEEDAGKEIQMGQEGFAGIEASAGVEAGGVVQDVEEDLFVGVCGQPGVRGGIILPESAVVAGLPAFDRFGWGFEAGVGSQIVLDGPAADTGAVGGEVEAAVEFAGGGAVGRGRFGGQEFGEQIQDGLRPSRIMVAAGTPRRPSVGAALGASAEVLAVELVEAGQGKAQFVCGG